MARYGAQGSYYVIPAAFTCDTKQSALARDVQRWADLLSLRHALISRGTSPTLQAGTFLRATVSSAWPSWNSVFGPELGGALPADPVNKHGLCVGACAKAPAVSCASNEACGADGPCSFDPETCWNVTQGSYQCAANSNVYVYRSYGPNQFTLQGDLETRCGKYNGSYGSYGGYWWYSSACYNDPLCTYNFTSHTCEDRNGASSVWRGGTCIEQAAATCPTGPTSDCEIVAGKCQFKVGRLELGGTLPIGSACVGTPIGSTGVCGDGVVNGTEQCEPGQTRILSCTVSGRTGSAQQQCTADCLGWTPTSTPGASPWPVADADCQVGSCGDGVIQAPEQCDDGDALNGTYGHCKHDCTTGGFSCGDGKRQPNETCDCKDLNGSYYFNGVVATAANNGVDGQPACGSFTGGSGAPSCSWDCSAAGPRCGDNIKNETEICDGNFEEFKGYCNNDVTVGCNTNADCPGSSCGNFCPTVEQKRRRACSSNDPMTTGDDAAACKWTVWPAPDNSIWTCTAPGHCGNGGAPETGEECDDGNTNNGDSCINDPAKNVICKKARCGDGYVNTDPG
ncbi:MAG: hypothetical protein AAB692_06180, partial [Patescibacteria group bacterium]